MIFYEPGKTSHGLPRNPFKALVTPRPIGWISTRSKDGIDNLAPFSQFNNLSFDPPYVMFSANQDLHSNRKDSVNNAEETGVFCWSQATWDLREKVNATAEWVVKEVDEFERAGLEKEPAKLVNASLVKASPMKFECVYYTTIRLPGDPPSGTADVIIGRVVGVHIDESILTDGLVDLGKCQPIARLGYYDYTVIRKESIFQMIIPGDAKQLVGLEGNIDDTKKYVANGQLASMQPSS